MTSLNPRYNVFISKIIDFQFTVNITLQHRIPVPTAINVPKVPPDCIMDFPVKCSSSLPRIPYLKQSQLLKIKHHYSFFTFSLNKGMFQEWCEKETKKSFRNYIHTQHFCPLHYWYNINKYSVLNSTYYMYSQIVKKC